MNNLEDTTIAELLDRATLSANGCIEWRLALEGSGYGSLKKHGKSWRAHRVMWTIQRGAIPQGMIVCHTCDNRKCINIDHLFLGTKRDNARDMCAKGRHADRRGEKSRTNKMTDATVRHARQLRMAGKSFQAIADELGVSETTIYRICKEQRWGHVV